MTRIEEIREALVANYGERELPIKDWRYLAIRDLLDRVKALEGVRAAACALMGDLMAHDEDPSHLSSWFQMKAVIAKAEEQSSAKD